MYAAMYVQELRMNVTMYQLTPANRPGAPAGGRRETAHTRATPAPHRPDTRYTRPRRTEGEGASFAEGQCPQPPPSHPSPEKGGGRRPFPPWGPGSRCRRPPCPLQNSRKGRGVHRASGPAIRSNPRGSLLGRPPWLYTHWLRPLGLGKGRTHFTCQRSVRQDNPGGVAGPENPVSSSEQACAR